MTSIKKFNKDTQTWEVFGSSNANQIAVMDLADCFTSKNVEGALGEIARKQQEIIGDIEWLKINGGGGNGGGGGSAPTLTSTFEDNLVVDKMADIIIPIFFNSPNLGNGLIYVSINGIEKEAISIKQGNNKINIGKLTSIQNKITFYAKDRTGSLSNELVWNITAGGIDFTLDFDYTADYIISDDIVMRYYINSAGNDPTLLHLTIDVSEYTIQVQNGNNEYTFPKLNVGVHKVKMKFTSGNYFTSETLFNLVIVNSDRLYLSTYFEGGTFIEGFPVPIDYRISKNSKENFTIDLKLNGEIYKTLSAPAGSYSWTLNDMTIGEYQIEVVVTGAYGETASFQKAFAIEKGDYVPLKINTQNLIYRLYAGDKTNNDNNRELPVDTSGNQVKTVLHNFNFYTNGWIDGALTCDGNAYVEIDCTPWQDNAIYGSTIEIQYKALDVGFDEARIFDYTDIDVPFKGAYIDINECSVKSVANTGTSYLNKDEWATVSFVVDRKNKFCKTYIDGVCSRAFFLSDTGTGTSTAREDFAHAQKIYLNSKKGTSHFGACEIKDVRVYSRALSDDEILNNFIAQEKDLSKQRQEYLFNYENTSVPIVEMYGDTSKMTLETPVSLRVKYTSPNEDLYGQSFDLPYCDVNWQGTSSLQYVLKNYTLNLKDANMAPFEYTPFKDGIPETVFCLKCDYMESTHARNAGLAKFVNDSLYDAKNPAQLKDARYRNSINGFPVLVYINSQLQGVYNFNLDRYSVKSYGYKAFDKTVVYEVSANSDTTAGAFHKWTSASGKDEISYYRSDFEPIYPPTRVAGNDNFAEIIRLVNWVNDSSDENFKDNFDQYFNLEYTLRYYLSVLVFGAVDSLGKNMKLTTFDGLIWYPQMYDLDTTFGLDNTGFLKFGADIEIGDEGVFNTTESILWKRVRLLFAEELKAQYSLMRQGRFTVNNLMKFLFDEQINKIPKRFYNWDMQEKYLKYESSYLYALHGSSYHHLKKWIQERLIYVDTLIGYTNSTADYITIRSSKLGAVYLDIETYIPLYLRVKWRDEANNTGVQIKRIAKGEKVRFEYMMPTATDQEIIIYGGHYLKSIGDVSNLQPTTMLIANADRLTEITCHSPNLINTDLNECTKLQRINLSDCSALGTGIGAQPILNIQQCKYLRSVNVSNTSITAVYTMAAGGNLEEMYLSDKTQIVSVSNQKHLKVLGLPYDVSSDKYCKNLSTVSIENCNNIEHMCYPFEINDPLEFKAFKYVRTLSLTASLDKLKAITFEGFNSLATLSILSMPHLENLGFENMVSVNSVPTLKTVRIGDCPLVVAIDFKIVDELHKIAFTNDSILDLSGLQSLKSIRNNAPIEGLKTLNLPNSVQSVIFDNASIDVLSIGDNDALQTLSLSNCANLTGVMDLSNCDAIEHIRLAGTAVNEIKLSPQNTSLKTLTIPNTLKTLFLINQTNLTTYQGEGYDNIINFVIQNTPIVNPIYVFNNAPKLEKICLMDIDIRTDYKTVLKLILKNGISATGQDRPLSESVSGKIALDKCSAQLMANFKQALPLVTFEADVILPEYNVTFIDGNGKTIYTESVILNDSAAYVGDTPQKTSTIQYDYTFNGWDKALNSITGHTTITALFTEVLRSYTIRFVNSNTSEAISTQNVLYGEFPQAPVIPDGLNNWDQTITPVTGDKTYFAILVPYPDDLTIFDFTEFGDGYSVALKDIACQDTVVYPFSYNQKFVTKIEQPDADIVSRANVVSVYIPNTITVLGNNAFKGFSGLNEFTIVDNIVSLGNGCFSGCNFSRITVPDGIVALNNKCFQNCAALAEISIPNSVTSFGDYCFSGCSSLVQIAIPESITVLPNYCFNDCVSLTQVTIHRGITNLGNYCFYNCSTFIEIVIPASVTTIGSACFGKCSNLKTICNYAKINQTIGDTIFLGARTSTRCITYGSAANSNFKTAVTAVSSYFTWTELFILGDNVSAILESEGKLRIFGSGDMDNWTTNTYPLSTIKTAIRSVIVEEGVTSIGSLCFYNMYAFYKIEIADTVTKLEDSCLGGSKISQLKLPKNLIKIGDGAINSTQITEIEIPDGTISLGNACFSGCGSLKKITIPASVKTIGNNCFQYCSNLQTVYNHSRTNQTVGSGLFYSVNPALKCIVYGYLENTNFKAAVDSAGTKVGFVPFEATFQLGDNITATFEVSAGSLKIVGTGKMYSGWTSSTYPLKLVADGVKTITIEDGITNLENYCFYNCTFLTEVVIPNSVAALGDYCFYGCSLLTEIIIPNDFASLGGYCFYGCKSSVQITIPSALTTIKANCFYNCVSLTQITIPNNVTILGDSCFYGCGSLTQVTIPEGVTRLEGSSFYNCYSLTKINIPANVTYIGSNCFGYCSKLQEIYNYAKKSQTLGTNVFNNTTPSPKCLVHGYDLNKNFKAAVSAVSTYFTWDPFTVLGDDIEIALDGDGNLNIFGSGPMYDWTSETYPLKNIAANIKTVVIQEGITTIGANCFYNCASLTQISIPNSITNMGASCFSGCTSLIQITIPNNVTSLGDSCFYNCSAFQTVYNYSKTNQTVGATIFNSAVPSPKCIVYGYLEDANFKAAVDAANTYFTFIPIEATVQLGDSITGEFNGLTGELNITGSGDMYSTWTTLAYPLKDFAASIKTVMIQEGVTSLGNSCFAYCSALTQITIPNNVTSLGDYCFYQCSSLTQITIPNNVTSLGYNCFYYCTSLTQTNIPSGVTNLREGCFYQCASLTQIIIPNSVTIIENSCFCGCASLTQITIPENVTSLGVSCFTRCTSLTQIIIPNNVTSLGAYCFSGCSKLQTIYNYSKANQTIGTNVFYDATPSPACKVYAYATNTNFKTAVTAVSIYFTWTEIIKLGDNIGAILDTTTGHLDIFGSGAMYNTWTPSTYPLLAIKTNIKTVTISEGITNIEAFCFNNCTSLTQITIPNSVTNLGRNCFNGCSSLTQIAIPENVIDVQPCCFQYCASLMQVTIHENVASIGSSCFYGCSKLQTIYNYSKASQTIDSSILSGATPSPKCIAYGYATNTRFKSIVNAVSTYFTWNEIIQLGDNIGAILDTATGHLDIFGSGDMYDIWSYTTYPLKSIATNIKTVSIQKGITSLGNNCFYSCTSLAQITISDSVTNIGNNCFNNCTSLAQITIPDSVISIGNSCFRGCVSLREAIVSKNIINLSQECFYGCTSLTQVEMPNSATSLGDSCFSLCSSLMQITIPDSVKSLGISCFSGCSALTKVIIPENVATVGTYCFNNCLNITTIINYSKTNQIISTPILDGVKPSLACQVYGYSTNINFKNVIADIPAYFVWNELPETVTTTESLNGNAIAVINNVGDVEIYSSNVRTYSLDNADSLEYYKNLIRNVKVNEGVTAINSDWFRNCELITEIELGSIRCPMTFIHPEAFAGTHIKKLMIHTQNGTSNDLIGAPFGAVEATIFYRKSSETEVIINEENSTL